MRNWPTWAWVALTLLATALRLDYTVGDYSAATAVALLAGSVLGSRRGAMTQALALLPIPLLSWFGWLAGPLDAGYFVGRIAAAAAAGRWAAADRSPVVGWTARLALVAMFVVAAWSTSAWREPTLGLQLKTYYVGVIGLGVVIGFWYALRLVAQPARIFGFVASLAPYYALGLIGIALGSVLVDSPPAITATEVVFQGVAVHLPGDVLSAVVVAFLLDPRTPRSGLRSR